jgi:hypothetical protein
MRAALGRPSICRREYQPRRERSWTAPTNGISGLEPFPTGSPSAALAVRWHRRCSSARRTQLERDWSRRPCLFHRRRVTYCRAHSEESLRNGSRASCQAFTPFAGWLPNRGEPTRTPAPVLSAPTDEPRPEDRVRRDAHATRTRPARAPREALLCGGVLMEEGGRASPRTTRIRRRASESEGSRLPTPASSSIRAHRSSG